MIACSLDAPWLPLVSASACSSSHESCRLRQYNADVDSEKRQYRAAQQRSREQMEAMLKSGEPEPVIDALLSAAYYDPDWRWVELQCLQALTHADLWVRRNAATCLGLLAVFHQKLDTELVVAALKKAGKDEEVRPWVEDSLSDIDHSMKKK
jgi:hypothetical protein